MNKYWRRNALFSSAEKTAETYKQTALSGRGSSLAWRPSQPASRKRETRSLRSEEQLFKVRRCGGSLPLKRSRLPLQRENSPLHSSTAILRILNAHRLDVQDQYRVRTLSYAPKMKGGSGHHCDWNSYFSGECVLEAFNQVNASESTPCAHFRTHLRGQMFKSHAMRALRCTLPRQA
jgi:hypothetical protein